MVNHEPLHEKSGNELSDWEWHLIRVALQNVYSTEEVVNLMENWKSLNPAAIRLMAINMFGVDFSAPPDVKD